jgi:plastocyanin
MKVSQRLARIVTGCLCLCVIVGLRPALGASASLPVTGDVTIVAAGKQDHSGPGRNGTDASDVLLWLIPLDASARPVDPPTPNHAPQVVQRNKTFEPHVLAVQVGTAVEFPNEDPFFHNIFSLFDGRRFDLGLYEAGSTRSVRFDRAGVSFLFCNIHPQMSAVVIAVDTPYFALSNRTGHWVIPDVPEGRYEMHVWYERSLPEELRSLARIVVISASSRSVGRIRINENPNFTLAHKNKYGQDYVPPPPSGYVR